MSSLSMGGEGGDFWGLCLTADVGLSWSEASPAVVTKILCNSSQTADWR